MLTVIHLEPEEFAHQLYTRNTKVEPRIYVLENRVAGIVYTTRDTNHFYYLDRFYPALEKREIIENMDTYALHKEVYRLVNLDNRNH